MSIAMEDFHDATLVGVTLDWTTGTATVVLRTTVHGGVEIKVADCTEVLLTRREEWGRSVSVMSMAPLDGDISMGLLIEMQSGDLLIIRGNAHNSLVPVPGISR